MIFSWTALWEAVKGPLRVFVLSVIPFLIAYLTEVNYEWAAVATLVLKMIDSYLHELAKEEPAKTRNDGYLGVKGLTNF